MIMPVVASPIKGKDIFDEVNLLEARQGEILVGYAESDNHEELQIELGEIAAVLQKYYAFADSVTWSLYA